jgi:phage gpG-like protein
MNPKDFIKNIISDVRVDLTEEFDRNFERKAFFDKKWRGTNLPNQRGSLLMRSGKLRRSIKSTQRKGEVTWSSSLPYASINNEGGEIVVTEKMKSFFWAMYYKSSNAIVFNIRKKAAANTVRNRKLSAEAQQWKNLALQKVGSVMKIEQRQFIGDHPIVRQRIEDVIGNNFKELETYFYNKLKQR